MCGILGIINFDDNEVDIQDLVLMSNKMLHRGPDDKGFYVNKNVGIGMRRLSIIDPKGYCQPIYNEKKTIHLVMNGEIYNYIELRDSLIQKGYKFYTDGDAEVLVHLYEEMGFDAINEINGMFSFAIYDAEKDITWIARDRIGIKPLFYCRLNNRFIFSSDLSSLNLLIKSPTSRSSILSYLGHSYIPEPKTIYKDIYKLEAATQIIIKNKEIKKFKYWSLDNRQNGIFSIKSASQKLDLLLENSARLHTRSDVPIGLLLSGGIDSSALAAYISKDKRNIGLNSFTAEFQDKKSEDLKFSLMVAKKYRFKHIKSEININDQLNAINELIPIIDEPMADSALIPTYLLSKRAQKEGIKVLLTGAGGDEIFGGYDRHFINRKIDATWLAHNNFFKFFFQILSKYIYPDLFIRFKSTSINYAAMISGINYDILSKLLINNKDFNFIIDELNSRFSNSRKKNISSRMKIDLGDYLPNNILALTDKATMAASIEGRVPFLDHRLIEFCYSLPDNINFYKGEPKGLFKLLMKDTLPKQLLDRKKDGFNAPTNKWFNEYSYLLIDEIITNPNGNLFDILDINFFKSFKDSKNKYRSPGQTIYSIYFLNKWLNFHAK